jgi:nucleotide-binding universal stress UspA family protein
LAIAEKTRAALTIAHAYNSNSKDSSGLNLKRQAEAKIKNMIDGIGERNYTVNYVIMPAAPLTFIKNLSFSFDLVVMGTQGTQVLKDLFGGRITSSLIEQTKTPVLIIPHNFTYKPFKNTVLALDSQTINEAQTIEVLQEITRCFESELTLFHTEENALDLGIREEIFSFFDEKVGYAIDYNFASQSVPKSIEDMVIDYDVDLIALIRRKKGFLEAILHPSITKREALHSKVPLLVLHDTFVQQLPGA